MNLTIAILLNVAVVFGLPALVLWRLVKTHMGEQP